MQTPSKHVRFSAKGNLDEYIWPYFGLGPVPNIFTNLLEILVALWQRINIRLIIYLDDIIVMEKTLAGSLTS